MKSKLKALLLMLSLSISFPLWAQEMQSAETLYREGQFSDALASYELILKTKPKDPFVYYNIGNCYFKMGSTGLAVANYYRAFRLAPRDADIRHNLSLAMAQSGDKWIPEAVPPALHRAFFSLSYNELKGLSFIALWFFCTLGSVWLIKGRLGRTALVALGILAVLAIWWYTRWQIEKQPLAVIAAPIAEIRSGPGTNFPASASVTQGHLVLLQDTKDNWNEVIIKSRGLKGWIEHDSVEKI